MRTLAENIRFYREKAGLSQDGLARSTALTTNTIGNIETGRVPNPSIDTVGRIADALDISIDDLWENLSPTEQKLG